MQYFSQLGFILALVSSLFFVPYVLAEQAEKIGSVSALQGKASAIHQEGTQAEPLALQSPLYPMDTIQTGAASKIKLTLIDGTVLTLGEQSKLQITNFVYAPQQRTHRALFTIPLGVFRAVAQKVFPESRFEVATSNAVAALRGTDWMGEVKPDSTAIVVLEGKVAVSHAGTNRPGEVVLTKGMGTDVDKGQPPTAPKKWGKARIDALREATMLP